jgi:hypothetical protein
MNENKTGSYDSIGALGQFRSKHWPHVYMLSVCEINKYIHKRINM